MLGRSGKGGFVRFDLLVIILIWLGWATREIVVDFYTTDYLGLGIVDNLSDGCPDVIARVFPGKPSGVIGRLSSNIPRQV
ncbi:hypothetical protein SDC9_97069 [bioreactor metagenome]|uniref:Uncharacterized protein n=1 Tax=bioreactor metagenome TaxID=1076179 RepID=A0A645AAW4_9ZZZZ